MRSATRLCVAVLLLAAGGCRPDSHNRNIVVEVPVEDIEQSALVRPQRRLQFRPGEVPGEHGKPPRGLRPAETTRVYLPRNEPVPRGMKTDPI